MNCMKFYIMNHRNTCIPGAGDGEATNPNPLTEGVAFGKTSFPSTPIFPSLFMACVWRAWLISSLLFAALKGFRLKRVFLWWISRGFFWRSINSAEENSAPAIIQPLKLEAKI